MLKPKTACKTTAMHEPTVTPKNKIIHKYEVIGRKYDNFFILETLFETSATRGATGVILRPVSVATVLDMERQPWHYLKDLWQEVVSEGFTEESLKTWSADRMQQSGVGVILDLSFSRFHHEVCELYNSELPKEHPKDREAEICDARGCGRIFGEKGKKLTASLLAQRFDKVYTDEATLALIAEYETPARKKKGR